MKREERKEKRVEMRNKSGEEAVKRVERAQRKEKEGIFRHAISKFSRKLRKRGYR